MKKIINSKKTLIILLLIIIIVLQLVFKIYRSSQKEDYFIDEIYSYALINYDRAFIFQKEDFVNNWHTKDYFDEYVTISEDEKFDFSPVYKNQVEDVHPPLYYLLLRIASMPTVGNFTKWSGLILNIIISSISLIVVYLIGKRLLKSDIYAIILAIIYGFSKFSVENILFIRMYQLLELNILLLIHWHIRNNENKEIKNREWFKLGILYITGFLTHYYYVIAAVGIYIVSIVHKIKDKDYKSILKYHVTIIISALTCTIIFPAWISHVFFGYRGQGSLYKVTIGNFKLFYIMAKQYIKLINNNMFGIKFQYVFIPIFLLFFINLIKEKIKLIEIVKKDGVINITQKTNPLKRQYNIWYVIAPIVLYLLVIIKTAPYIELRYILSILALINIFTIYLLKQGLEGLIKSQKLRIVIFIIIGAICVISSVSTIKLEFIYKGNKEEIDNIRENYADIPCIYIYDNQPIQNNNFVSDFNYLRQFNNVYILDSNERYKIEEILKQVDTSKGFMVYDYRIDQDQTIINMVDNGEYSTLEEITRLNYLLRNIIYIY